MWTDQATIIFKRCILATQLSSCFTSYVLGWDEKSGKAFPASPRHHRAYKILTLVMTLVIQPILWLRCYHLARELNRDLTHACIAYVAAALFAGALPFLWYFLGKERPQEFIASYESVFNGNKFMEGNQQRNPERKPSCYFIA